MTVEVRELGSDELEAAARVHRASFDAALPWLSGLHTPAEDAAFFRERVGPTCSVWGAGSVGGLLGIVAWKPGWIEQLYVLPVAQGRGVGSALLARAMATEDELSLWTFQRNAAARRFYEGRGFAAVRETDGAGNEEREPDVLYRWRRMA